MTLTETQISRNEILVINCNQLINMSLLSPMKQSVRFTTKGRGGIMMNGLREVNNT